MKSNMPQRLFPTLMLLSGFAGISYEILYGRILGNMIGDQFVVSAAILMTFLLGIGLGSVFAHRLWRWLWAIEGGIGIYGLWITLSQSWIESFVYSGSSVFPDHLMGSVVICVLLLIVPAFLIGCSVPLFAGYFSRLHADSKSSFSRVYMVYNLGAALTSLLIEFYLIRQFGIQGAVIMFAAVNLLIAIGLKFGFEESIARQQPITSDLSLRRLIFALPAKTILALVLASIASAIFQLFMVKYAELIFGPFRESFALVLAWVLLGITLGSWCVKRFSLSFQVVMIINIVSLIFLMLAAGWMPYLYAAIYPLTGSSFGMVVLLKAIALAILMIVPAMSFGATVPALLTHKGEVAHESGSLLFISSLANVAGFLLMVFLLHRFLDYGVQLFTIGLLSVLALLASTSHSKKRLVAMAGAVAVMGGVLHKQWDEDLLYLSYTNFKDYEDLIDARENAQFPERYKGYQDVFSINYMDGDPYFFINGYISIPLNNPSEKEVGALSTLFSPRLDDALVLGLGSGATASSVGLFFEHTDVVEINPVVRENLFRMRQWNFDIENNAKVDIHVDDAIHYIRAGEKPYSLILNTVTTPLYFSSSKLYTSDFFDDVKVRLKDDGVYVTWMDSRIGDVGADIILRSLKNSFKYCAALYVKSAYFLLIASDHPLTAKQQQEVTNHKLFKEAMFEKHEIMSSWLPYHLMTTDVFALIGDTEGPLNTSDSPVLEFEMARLQESGIPKFKRRLLGHFDISEIEHALPQHSESFPADFLEQVDSRLGTSSIARRWNELLEESNSQTKIDLKELEYRKVKMDVRGEVKDYHAYGYQLMKLERYEEALTVFEKVLQRDSQHDNTFYNMGSCYESLGQLDLAVKAFRNELEIDPEDADAAYRSGRLLVQMKQYDEGLMMLNRYISSKGISVGRVYFYRAMANWGKGNRDEATEDLSKAIGLVDEDSKLLESMDMIKEG
ncbi:MAG: spermine synthase [Zetaproteobacteria bacterium CG_4_9_14_3_um_filter_49_83]|nr:MAG: spermine synthase [Zetaproteobacteria bacterium CG17_big_fil_post_rev_8_21_14_2_50_50_13]PIV30376.1 MAG: spermine synthase [Zetaproteobacteria bacterium CG02_land_8_20_14_3_00_50_9]PIY56046.1 MAG: spermine synthase [Zetaproteobacteria bacterium CG_4_10_14_0_8_um_filter_49_80]PJA36278.1 MAG: spermine synthase [Zetaproteobacteria bacterium CG_4_9_14_3_um_filter_49_83]